MPENSWNTRMSSATTTAPGREQVEALRADGKDVLLEIDWQGAQQVRASQPDCCTIFIMPPSVAELERRLRDRRTDSEEVITRRLDEAVGDMSHWREFDHVVVNDDVETAAGQLLAVMRGEGEETSTGDSAVVARITHLLGSDP